MDHRKFGILYEGIKVEQKTRKISVIFAKIHVRVAKLGLKFFLISSNFLYIFFLIYFLL